MPRLLFASFVLSGVAAQAQGAHPRTLRHPAAMSHAPSAAARAAHEAAVRAASARAALAKAEAQRRASLTARDAARSEARHDAAQADALSRRSVDAAARLRQTEARADDLAGQVATLAQKRAEAQARRDAATRAVAGMLPLMERLSLYPSEALLAAPLPPGRAVAGLLVLRGLSRMVEQQAELARDEQHEIAALDDRLRDETAHLDTVQAVQAQQRDALEAQSRAARQQAQASAAAAHDAARVVAQAAANAASLRDAVDAIATAERQAQAHFAAEAEQAARRSDPAAEAEAHARQAAAGVPAGPGLSAGRSRTPVGAPVAGTVARGWGAPTDAGPATGITYAAASLAVVSSPCDGKVAFAGPFRSYGQMLIVDCGKEYRFVLAGLDRLDATLGDRVARGAPLGRMGTWNPTQDAKQRPSLYVQLRHGAEAINPARFLGG